MVYMASVLLIYGMVAIWMIRRTSLISPLSFYVLFNGISLGYFFTVNHLGVETAGVFSARPKRGVDL